MSAQYPQYLLFHESKKRQDGSLLIVAGLHGDEGSVIQPLSDFLQKNSQQLPRTLFIPEMSPSALARHDRKNAWGHDLNRTFGLDINDPEKSFNEKIVYEHGIYDVVVSFHEDTTYKETYVYDLGEQFYHIHLGPWKKRVKEIGLGLLTGIDDDDDTLGKYFVDGYYYEKSSEDHGHFEHWVLRQKLSERSLTVEVPTSATEQQKSDLIAASFEYFIFPAFV